MQKAEIAVIGAGAAGLMAALTAARAAPGARIVALDGASRLGAKILIAGGGRCNVTHHAVDERDFNGSTPAAIRRVLRAFDVDATRRFFEAEGVALKREDTGKLFPVSDKARDVLDALVRAATRAGVVLDHPRRVRRIVPAGDGFDVHIGPGAVNAASQKAGLGQPALPSLLPYLTANVVILAAGGRSVPKTGSDGAGESLAADLGLPLTPRIFPALVPLLLPAGHPLGRLSGLATDVRLTVVSSTGKHLRQASGALLCTHQGLSGPAVLDVSRHWQDAVAADPRAGLLVDWLPGPTMDELDARVQGLGSRSVRRALTPPLPERLADLLCELAGVDPAATGAVLRREDRRRLVQTCREWRAPVTGTRGFSVAEVTAGGVPLTALTAGLESRDRAGVYVCGELCDVDGRIGGFNFQWAWASGTVAGRAAAAAVNGPDEPVSR
ncbi:MAG TPA: aminoacetone oxidase family FAD-binding enzyme [Luteitalea sp.]|nr:aminoacetone oxidase family FAD-binding enzyme [Luteitalea sp.]